MNKVQLSGRPTRDPEINKYMASDRDGNAVERKVASFTLAVDILSGRKQENALFIRCSGFGKTAEIIENNVKKSKKIIVEGHLHENNYVKDNVKIYSTDVIIENVEFCSSNQNNETNFKQGNSGDGEFVDNPDDEMQQFLEMPSPF